MSWLRRLRREYDPPPITDEEITAARDRAEEGVRQARALDAEVREVVARLRRQREENHFGPLIWAALRGESDV
ncbi:MULTISPECIES: DUF7620 family protein [unclassified Nocardiopsis]|uniref:DUF7620 family protein n=1 Tax=Nocardiopsis TaxID=2013 RepID=UPI00387AC136